MNCNTNILIKLLYTNMGKELKYCYTLYYCHYYCYCGILKKKWKINKNPLMNPKEINKDNNNKVHIKHLLSSLVFLFLNLFFLLNNEIRVNGFKTITCYDLFSSFIK